MKRLPMVQVSDHAITLAKQLTDQAHQEAEETISDTQARFRGRQLGWQARLREVNAHRPSMAALYLEALAVLGDEGAKRGLQEDAVRTAKVAGVSA